MYRTELMHRGQGVEIGGQVKVEYRGRRQGSSVLEVEIQDGVAFSLSMDNGESITIQHETSRKRARLSIDAARNIEIKRYGTE
ncbi:hypothetical protein [Chromobacterium phragmitis]|uniref:Uncharacterized protein n=1 Tax=Chromobacterium phragmitis TaxID=2202141 RepID=A0A344UPD1_9NEIS|nr:hypothetical protein [Chromobacterium phragmitis]AXE37129.1 hypothetical protein DK843_22525 [Chromobacterium phragmitis]AXE37190.1 hypothetical protein DK843_22845 [Chromobacterium phragmitis]